MYTAKHMKWWGWGDDGVSFDSRAHPGLWPYAKAALGVEEEKFRHLARTDRRRAGAQSSLS